MFVSGLSVFPAEAKPKTGIAAAPENGGTQKKAPFAGAL
jgi:hypothetical protein